MNIAVTAIWLTLTSRNRNLFLGPRRLQLNPRDGVGVSRCAGAGQGDCNAMTLGTNIHTYFNCENGMLLW